MRWQLSCPGIEESMPRLRHGSAFTVCHTLLKEAILLHTEARVETAMAQFSIAFSVFPKLLISKDSFGFKKNITFLKIWGPGRMCLLM